MKIEFSPEEYRLLLDMLYIAEWVMSSHKTEKDPEVVPYEALEQKLLALAIQMGFGDLVEYDDKLKKHFPTRLYEDTAKAMAFIEEYDNDSFWEELAQRLATRDLIQKEGKKLETMDRWERLNKQFDLAEQYTQEFVEHGLERLVVQKVRPQSPKGLRRRYR